MFVYSSSDLNSTPQSSTSNTYNQYHTDTDSTRQRKRRETDENNTNQFRQSTQYTPRRKAKPHTQSTAERDVSVKCISTYDVLIVINVTRSFLKKLNHIRYVIVSVPSSCVVDRGFETRSGQIKVYNWHLLAASLRSKQHSRKMSTTV